MAPFWIEKNVGQRQSGLGNFFGAEGRARRELWTQNKENLNRLT